MARTEPAAGPQGALVLGALLVRAEERLAAAGAAEPRREALRLWAGLRDENPGQAWLERARAVAPEEAARFEAAVARRARGEPLAYATGRAGFRTLVLRADARALIPRPETEGLVERVLALAPAGRVADVGTGTGCIALSLRAEGGYADVLALDLSAEALALARENVRATGLGVTLVRGDLTAPLATGALDALVSNPPYLTEHEYAGLDGAVRAWEPRLALPSGTDGLEATTRLLDDGRRVVRPGGLLALEVDCTRAAEAARRAAALGWTGVTVEADLYGRERYLLARRSEAR
ncbi:MAG TPA: peptide chain release factor N(5)-glutamine methyltransferase [Gemmatimonadales bacterium]|nr:peptide chain release factor N(5)-glutamine methyltransferase [Gemmatimonadales bacterium]